MNPDKKWMVSLGKSIKSFTILSISLPLFLSSHDNMALATSAIGLREIDVTKMPIPAGSSTMWGERDKIEWNGNRFQTYAGSASWTVCKGFQTLRGCPYSLVILSYNLEAD